MCAKGPLFFLATALLAALFCSRVNAKSRRLDSSSSSSSSSIDIDPRPSTDFSVLIQVEARPSLLTEYQYVVLEESFVEAYNDLAESECTSSEGSLAVEATIDRVVGEVLPSSTQLVSLEYKVTVKGDSLFHSQEDLQDYACSTLTEEAFAVAYSQALQTRRDDLRSSLDTVASVAEMKQLSCNDGPYQFQPDVLVTFVGDPAMSTSEQLDALARSFGQTYNAINSLNPETCDPFLRQVVEETVITEDGTVGHHAPQRFLQTGTRFSYLYRNIGRCNTYCAINSPLFDDGSSSGELFPQSPAFFAQGESDCMCPVGATEQRGPTADEFKDAYETTISILREAGIINDAFIASVVDVRQVYQVECGPLTTFKTQVYVDLSGNSQTVTQEEVDALDVSFGNTYKQLAADFCDPYFRDVVDLTIDTTFRGRSRRLQRQDSSSFTYAYDVTASCRGCGENARLFSQSVGRMLGLGLSHGQRFQNNNLCFCGFDVINDRSPSVDEYAMGYNDTVHKMNLPNVDQVLGVFEGELPSTKKSKKSKRQLDSTDSGKTSWRDKPRGELDGTNRSKSVADDLF